MIPATPSLTDTHRRLVGDERAEFERATADLASGQRSNRPRLVIEAILEVAQGFAAVTVTQVELARRIGCGKARAINDAIVTLIRLGAIYDIRDPRERVGRHIVLAKHPEAERIVAELSRCRQVVASNPHFRDWIEKKSVPEQPWGTRPYIPYDEGLGRLIRLRDLRRARAL